jgi:hypothetical protein
MIISLTIAHILTEASITALSAWVWYLCLRKWWDSDRLFGLLVGAVCFFAVYIPLFTIASTAATLSRIRDFK